MNVTIIVATYGTHEWRKLGDDAMAKARSEAAVERVHLPDGTLAEARNLGAHEAKTDWLCFLDGDDELAPGYIWAMHDAAELHASDPEGERESSRALLVPRVQYVRGRGRADRPRIPVKPASGLIQDGSWLVIGTLIQREVFWEVGGFEEWPIYEDWALFARAWKAGAEIVEVPNATYVAHRRPRSRNHATGRNGKLAAHDAIRRAVFPELYEEVT